MAEAYNYGDTISSDMMESMERDCKGPNDPCWTAADETVFNPIIQPIPSGKYVVRLLFNPNQIHETEAGSVDFLGSQVVLSDQFEVKRDPLRGIKNFCRETGWGYSTVHKAINEHIIPPHLVVGKTKTCNKRRVYMSADAWLTASGKRKCKKHRRPNRRRLAK